VVLETVLIPSAMKNKSEKTKIQVADKSPERLKRLKALNKRLRGSMPNFMTQEELRKMREDDKMESSR
jgi:hypothetical protein